MKIPLSYNIRSMKNRRNTTLVTAVGVCLVVFVFTSSLMLNYGLRKTLVETGSRGNAVVIRKSSQSEMQSIITRASASILAAQPEVAKDAQGNPLAAAESVVLINLKKRDSDEPSNVTIRGVSAQSLAIREQVHIVEGRPWTQGSSEIIAGQRIAGSFQGCGLGETVRFGSRDWTVVGLFDAGKSGFESELWGDVDQLMQAYGRPVYSSLTLRLQEPVTQNLVALKERVESDPRLTSEVFSEETYYENQTRTMSIFIAILGNVISALFSLGAIVGAMITMYATVAGRIVEIGTLRALGFKRRSILASFLIESILLSLLGGAMGVALATLTQFLTVSTTNWDTFSEVAFSFAMNPTIVAAGMIFAAVMGLVGGFLPAVRASRMGIVDALRTA
jgi:ABC-type antimicrobial peptide transport system permease subunit